MIFNGIQTSFFVVFANSRNMGFVFGSLSDLQSFSQSSKKGIDFPKQGF